MTIWDDPMLSPIFIIIWMGMLTLLWALMAGGVHRWGHVWRVDKPSGPPPKTGPVVSICIPARNEEHNIGDCVRAALQTNWPEFEVLVVDDRSEDKTATEALAAGAGDTRLRIVSGVPPQLGWAGKPWACYRAAREAQGAWLLFIDADVRIHPDAVRAALGLAQERDLALLSFFGRWTLKGFWEAAVIPAVGWLIRGTVNFDRSNVRSYPEAFANGQFIFMSQKAYASVGGHKAVFDQVLEDVRLAEAVKRAGYGTEIRPAGWAFSVRLYTSLMDIINGYTKNLYEGMGRKPIMGLGAALFIVMGTLLPFVALVAVVVGRLFLGWTMPAWGWAGWLLLICSLQFLFRWEVERFDQRRGWMALSHPLANVILVWILLRSTFRMRVKWKGRSFVDGRAASEE